MTEYRIPREVARSLAVGLFSRDIAAFVKAADPADLQHFRDEYEARQTEQAPAPVKRRQSRNHRAQSR